MTISKSKIFVYIILIATTIILSIFIFIEGSKLKSNKNKIESNPIHSVVKYKNNESENRIGNIPTPDLKNLTFVQEMRYLLERTLLNTNSKILILIIIILFFARLLGVFFRKLGQPTVLGEILAGIFLGPSFLGWLFPEIYSSLFTLHQLEILEILSNFGLIILMFVIGMDIDLSYIRTKQVSIIMLNTFIIIFPFFSGLALAYFLFSEFSPYNIKFYEFAIFIGLTLTLTAYTLLQRILLEKGLSRTNIGNVAIKSSSLTIFICFVLLSIALAMVRSKTKLSLIIILLLTILYVIIMIFVFHPFLKRLSQIYVSKENLTSTAMAIVFVFLFFSSLFTEVIGLHTLIGAFFAGVLMPSDSKLKSLISEKIDYISLAYLLPLFFALIGARTDLRIFLDIESWIILGLVLAFATIGKFMGTIPPAKMIGMNWKDSLSLGVLMNTKGLIALMVLTIGFQVGILSSKLYTIFVVMALLSTFLSVPLLQWIQNIYIKFNPPSNSYEAFKKILISFAQPSMGVALIKLSNFLFAATKDKTQITVIHITSSENLGLEELKEYKSKTFLEIEYLTEYFGFNVEIVHRTTENITYEILNQVKLSKSRFLLMGAGRSLFTSNILGGRIRPILSYAPCNVGVLLDNGLDKIEKVLVLKKPRSSLGFEKLTHYLTRAYGSKKIKIYPVAIFTTLNHEDFNGYHLVIIEVDLWKEREEFLEMEIQSLEASFLIVQFK